MLTFPDSLTTNRRELSGSRLLTIILIVLFAIVLLKNSWLCVDSFIGLRVMDNIVKGYGFRYNAIERANPCTPVLWVFAMASVYYFTMEGFYTIIFLSIILSMFALIIYSKITPQTAFVGITVLILSKSYIDYSTAGLENSLSHLLLAVFFYVYLKTRANLLWLSLCGCLVSLNRLDSILLVLPILSYELLSKLSMKNIARAIIGFIPLIFWELFSLFYFGFPFPNSFYTKACSGIERIVFLRQGILYFLDSLLHDPVTLLVVFASIAMGLASGKVNLRLLSYGIILYLIYIVYIGGCYMSGRFFTMPLFCSVITIGWCLKEN